MFVAGARKQTAPASEWLRASLAQLQREIGETCATGTKTVYFIVRARCRLINETFAQFSSPQMCIHSHVNMGSQQRICLWSLLLMHSRIGCVLSRLDTISALVRRHGLSVNSERHFVMCIFSRTLDRRFTTPDHCVIPHSVLCPPVSFAWALFTVPLSGCSAAQARRQWLLAGGERRSPHTGHPDQRQRHQPHAVHRVHVPSGSRQRAGLQPARQSLLPRQHAPRT